MKKRLYFMPGKENLNDGPPILRARGKSFADVSIKYKYLAALWPVIRSGGGGRVEADWGLAADRTDELVRARSGRPGNPVGRAPTVWAPPLAVGPLQEQ